MKTKFLFKDRVSHHVQTQLNDIQPNQGEVEVTRKEV